MANYHILEQSVKGDNIKVAFHIPIPVENNFAGFSLNTALVQYQESTLSQVPFITPSEQSELDAGTLCEVVKTVKFNAHLTNTQKKQIVDGLYNNLEISVVARLRHVLAFWGFSVNLP